LIVLSQNLFVSIEEQNSDISTCTLCIQQPHVMLTHDVNFLINVRPYRPRYAPDKPYICDISGCGKSYYRRTHLQRHQKEKHF